MYDDIDKVHTGLGFVLDTTTETTMYDRNQGAIRGAVEIAKTLPPTIDSDNTTAVTEQFQTAITNDWTVAYHLWNGEDTQYLTDCDPANPTLKHATLDHLESVFTVAFTNGWLYDHLQGWIQSEPLAETLRTAHERSMTAKQRRQEKTATELSNWDDVRPAEDETGEIIEPVRYVHEKTWFAGTASEVIAHAAGYEAALNDIFGTLDEP